MKSKRKIQHTSEYNKRETDSDLENKVAVTSGEKGGGRINKGRGKSGYYGII